MRWRRCLWQGSDGLHFVNAVHGVLEERVGAVDGAHHSGDGQRGVAEALVHPATVANVILLLHEACQVALSSVVETLHALGVRPVFAFSSVWRVKLGEDLSKPELLSACPGKDYNGRVTSASLWDTGREGLLVLHLFFSCVLQH